MKINEIMTADIQVLKPQMSIQQAAQLMRDADIACAPVVEHGKVRGILTDHDIVVRAVAEKRDPAQTRVSDVMTSEAILCYEDREVAEVSALMARNHIRRIPVLNLDDTIAGMVSLGDIAAETKESGRVPEQEAGGIVHMESLVKGELSAVETYKQALEKVPDTAPGGTELRRIESDHEQAAALLQERMAMMGEQPPLDSGLWGAWSKAVEGTAKIFGAKAAIKALQQGEKHGVQDYEDALKDAALDPDVKALIRSTLLPRARAHIPALKRVLREKAGI